MVYTCNVVEQLLFHIHAHLDIIINGVYFLVPSQIGIPGNCFFWLHTHDESGIIHIESPVNRDYTLGQFFDIWNKKLNNDQIFNYVANANNPLTVYVNGTKVPNGTNYRDIKLHAHDEIAIVYVLRHPLYLQVINFHKGYDHLSSLYLRVKITFAESCSTENERYRPFRARC